MISQCKQTGVALGTEVDDQLPQHEYYEYFGPDYTLHVAPSNMENKNTRQLLEEIRNNLLDNLSRLQHAPSVQFQERPPDTELPEVCSAAFLCYFLSCFSSFLLHPLSIREIYCVSRSQFLIFSIFGISHFNSIVGAEVNFFASFLPF